MEVVLVIEYLLEDLGNFVVSVQSLVKLKDCFIGDFSDILGPESLDKVADPLIPFQKHSD